ncbi:sn-glycerol-3-phosphate ABC transporter ATP-binding protein UgpC [Rhizobium sp. KVB221]|uniref:Sn-glycerol-3-phosphate ABC transporter ATP-binding protein UgpC n=1 Tax=Rhizobium setariae TaxID=2801340 RepID=A0A937CNA1_9HYPH|nr:sn-glycerol-3-phosphate ABC transporter ATP-binding protein UgpC [Rhizobium setariae]MBL0373536.1 sn-glycerol-3-phosphate ABC transporter ATP-binding protein UgpC [Rhizobium setariae]
MSEIELRSVRKSFGALDIIHGIDLAIEPGELCVFVGPSGCGKSTLLRMIAGLEDITDGEIHIGGRIVNKLDPGDREIAMVFQSYALYPHMTVAQNMGFGLRMSGAPKTEIARRVDEAAGILQLQPLLQRKPAQLSGGQRQRVAIGRAIVRNPKAFLFDEPLSNLDAELRVHMRVEIAKLHQALKTTMVYVTHDQVEAMTLADKIVVLRAGRVEQIGSPMELYNNPDNVFVAGFIGSPRINLLQARVGVNGVLTIGDCRFQPTLDVKLAEGEKVTVGLRPEHFDTNGNAEASLAMNVDVVENLGGTSIWHGSLSTGERLLIERKGFREMHPGDGVQLSFSPRDALIFDPNGVRLR